MGFGNNNQVEHPVAKTLYRTKGKKMEKRLFEIRFIYCGCAGFGQILRSFLLNSPHYSPQTIEKSDSNQHNLVTITNLGQLPRATISKAFTILMAFSFKWNRPLAIQELP